MVGKDNTFGRLKQLYHLQIDSCFYELIKHNYYMDDHKIIEGSKHLIVEIFTEWEDAILELALKDPTYVKVLGPQSTCNQLKEVIIELMKNYS